MNLTSPFTTAEADAEVQPVTVASQLPEAASAAASAYFDLDETPEAGDAFSGMTDAKTMDQPAGFSPVPTAPSGAASETVTSRGRGRSSSAHTSIPPQPYLAPVTGSRRETAEAYLEAEALAGVCREFERLLAGGAHSLRTAAAALGKPASFFSGESAPFARFKRHGLAGLLPAQRVAPSSMTVPPWFVPAARFFYLLTNRTLETGSVPEAVRRTISLPATPFGWTEQMRGRLIVALGLGELPTCPEELREQILARERAGKPLVPPSIARQIIVNASLVRLHRSPHNWNLDNLNAPGSQRRFTNGLGERQIMQPGDWFGGDDATPGIAVCVPTAEAITPCSQKFGVLLGRFQWLVYNDCRTDKILAWDYVIRPRGSYRAEDILNGMGAVVRTHGIPNQGFQFEGGTFNAKLVRQAIELLGCQHWRTHSPHAKPIESVFNRVWTRLAVQFPHADMGRYQNENEANCATYEACKAGHKDPRHYFPTLADVVTVFEEEVRTHNLRHINSAQYGRWVPDDLFADAVAARPLRQFSDEMQWIFSPYSVERTVKGMIVATRVPMFENFSVPFEFGADYLPLYHGKKVRLHFNPREPKCRAKVILMENANNRQAGDILGDAQLIGETAGHIRFITEFGTDDQRAGYLARQKFGQAMHRETRGIGASGRMEYARTETRDGISWGGPPRDVRFPPPLS